MNTELVIAYYTILQKKKKNIADCKIAYSLDCKIAVTSVRPLTMRTEKLFTEQSIKFQTVSAYSMNCEIARLHKALWIIIMIRRFYVFFDSIFT